VAVSGRVQAQDGVIHVIAERIDNLSRMLAKLSEADIGMGAVARADEVRRPGSEDQRQKVKPKSRAERTAANVTSTQAQDVMPKGRNFH
jgi:error-prone DNA polymerase